MATKNLERVPWGHKFTGSNRNDESNGLFKTLVADLRRQQLPKADRPEDDAWYEEEQAARREFSARIGKAHNVDPDRRENWRRRYWNS